MNIKPIRTEDDLSWALSEIEAYFLNLPVRGSDAADRFDVLVGLVQGYEAQHWAIEPSPAQVTAASALTQSISESRTARMKKLILKRHAKNMFGRRKVHYIGLGRNRRHTQKVG